LRVSRDHIFGRMTGLDVKYDANDVSFPDVGLINLTTVEFAMGPSK